MDERSSDVGVAGAFHDAVSSTRAWTLLARTINHHASIRLIHSRVDSVRRLIEETIRLYVSPAAEMTRIRSLPMEQEEQGWSGAELRRYRAELDGAGR